MSTSLSEIMSVTGMKKGSLYNHFKDKEELVSLAFNHCLHIFKQNMETAIANKSNSKDQLLAIIQSFCQFNDNTLPGGCPIVNVAVEVHDGLSVQIQEQAQYGMNYVLQTVAEIVEKGKQNGEFSKSSDSSKIASIIISACEGGLIMNKICKDKSHSHSVQEHLFSFVENEISV